jgi:CDP-diglyceride synthetase
MLKQRITTALLLLAVFLPALFHPDARWLGLAGLFLVAAGAWEWGRLNNMGTVSALLMPVICLMLCAVDHRLHCHEHYYYYLMLYTFGRCIEKAMSISIHAERSQKVTFKMSS